MPTEETTAALQRFLPIRVVFKHDAGKLLGLTEESFSMNWSESFVNVFWSGKAFSLLGEHTLNGITWAESNAEKLGGLVFDPFARDCPVEIDWERWLNAKEKYSKRNAPFKPLPFGAFVLRAMQAEAELAILKPRYESELSYGRKLEEKLAKVSRLGRYVVRRHGQPG